MTDGFELRGAALREARPFIEHALNTAVAADYRVECARRLDLVDRALDAQSGKHRFSRDDIVIGLIIMVSFALLTLPDLFQLFISCPL